ncbi:MAG: hypothetical protein ABR543_04430 [Gemmatimonadaceae bacterium]
MVAERNADHIGIASASRRARIMPALLSAVIMALGCGPADDPAPLGNTGPGTTVARIDILSGPASITVGDTARYTAVAVDNANYVLPVTLDWHSSNTIVLSMNSATGEGIGLEAGESVVFATAGAARSNNRVTRVNAKPAFP